MEVKEKNQCVRFQGKQLQIMQIDGILSLDRLCKGVIYYFWYFHNTANHLQETQKKITFLPSHHREADMEILGVAVMLRVWMYMVVSGCYDSACIKNS